MAWTILSTVIPALVAMATSAWGSVVGSFGKLGKFIGPVVGWFGKLGPWIARLVPMLSGMAAGLGTILGGIATAIGGLLAGITAPVWGIIAAVVAVGAGVIYFWDEIVEVSSKLWDGFKNLVGWFADGASAIWNSVTGFFSNALGGFIDILKSGASGIWNVITKPFTSLFGWLGNSWLGKKMGFGGGETASAEPTTTPPTTSTASNNTASSSAIQTASSNIVTTTTPIAGTISERQFASISTPSVDSNMTGNIVANQQATTGPKDDPTFTAERVGQLMSMVASIQNDIAAVRGNTRPGTSDAPVRLS